MNLKKTKILIIFITFLICFISHFIYEILPNPLFSIFFPVNESIWEHMKMLFTSILLSGIIEYIIIKKNNISVNNFIFSKFIEAFISIPIYLTIYLPIYYKIGEKMILNIILLFIVIIIVEYIGYKLMTKSENNLNILAIILIIVSYSIFTYLTYYPIKNQIFLDTKNEKYGIDLPIN